jgi:hypothetical protein
MLRAGRRRCEVAVYDVVGVLRAWPREGIIADAVQLLCARRRERCGGTGRARVRLPLMREPPSKRSAWPPQGTR